MSSTTLSYRPGTTSLGEIIRIRQEVEKRRMALLDETDQALARVKALLARRKLRPPSN